jgi:hypothetical protein
MDLFEEDIEVLVEYGRKDLADALRKHHLEGTSMPKALKEEIGSYIGGSEYEVSGSEDEEDEDQNTQPEQSVIDLTLPLNYKPIPHGSVIDLTKL